MKINIEIESTPEELAVLLCEIKAETKVPPVGNMGKSPADTFKEAEFYRQQRACGRSNF